MLYHLREKTFNGKGAVFGYPRCLPIEGRKNFSKSLIFGSSRDLPLEEENFEAGTTFDLSQWEQVKKYSKRVKKRSSRWLLFGGRNFLKAPRQMTFLTGNKWRKNNFIKAAIFGHSRCLPIEGTKLFLKTPTKTFSPSRNKWRNIQNRGEKTDFPPPTYWEDFEIHSKKGLSPGICKEIMNFSKNTPQNGLSHWE